MRITGMRCIFRYRKNGIDYKLICIHKPDLKNKYDRKTKWSKIIRTGIIIEL